LNTIDGPLAEDELHDGLAPAGERDGGRGIVGVTAATDERAIADTTGSFGERASSGGAGSEIAEGVEGDGPYGVVRVECGVVDAKLFGECVFEFCVESGLG
jgi:hypothetical protein